MSLTRREELTDVLRTVCLNPVMEKAYKEAEARLRKKPEFIKLQKMLKILEKAHIETEKAEEKIKRMLEQDIIEELCDRHNWSKPYPSFSIHNDFPELEIQREDTKVFVELHSNRHYHRMKHRPDVVEQVDMTASEALVIANEAIELAKLCVTEVELIRLIRETKERIAALKPAPKAKKKKGA